MTKRVLIVEDEILVALDLEDALTDAGYAIAGIAADRAEALALASKADIALVDLNLRDGATGVSVGMDLAETFGVRVVFLTANPSSAEAGARSAVGCLDKPCLPEHVCEAMDFAGSRDSAGRTPNYLKLFS